MITRRFLTEGDSDGLDLVTILNNLSYIVQKEKKYQDEALGYLKEALQICESAPNVFMQEYAITLNNLGEHYRERRKYTEAKKFHLDSLKFRRKLAESDPKKFLPYLGTALNNTGLLFIQNRGVLVKD